MMGAGNTTQSGLLLSLWYLLFSSYQDESAMPPEVLRKAKQLGFSDKQIAQAVQR